MASLARETGPFQQCTVLEREAQKETAEVEAPGDQKTRVSHSARLHRDLPQRSMLMGCLVRQLSPHVQ